MFAGVHMIILNENNTIVNGVSSKEGEEVFFENEVSITDNPKINDWLTLVEKEIRYTLATLLNQSVQESLVFRSGANFESKTYLQWFDRYQAQIVVLSAQISWSESIEL
jgi:dynein heavy chain 1